MFTLCSHCHSCRYECVCNFNLIVLVSAFGDVLLSLLFARVCFVPSVLLSKLVSLSVSCVRSLVCVLVCSFARLLIRLFLCMHLCLFVVDFCI